MTFTYTNPAGFNKQVDLDIDALLEFRLNRYLSPKPSWPKIAKHFSLSAARLTEIRKSPEWVVAVAEFMHRKDIQPHKYDLRDFGLDLDDVIHMDAPSGLTVKVGAWRVARWVAA